MRVILAVACLAMSSAVGNTAEVWGPLCAEPTYAPPTCAQEPSCEVPQRMEQPRQPPTPQQQQMPVAASQGVFVQPPASGVVRGPVEQRGVEGMSITFHGATLRFPSIQFPAFSRSRTGARMDIAAAAAPYVEGVPTAAALAPMTMASPMMMAPQAQVPLQTPMQPQAQSPPSQTPRQESPPQCYPPRPPGCEAPQAPMRSPGCDAYYSKQAALEEKLRAIEMAERRLAAQVAQLQQLTQNRATAEQHQPQNIGPPMTTNQPAGFVPASGGLRAAGNIYQGRMPANAVTPVQYIEPATLPPEMGIIREPMSPIREPSPPRAQITAVRSR